MGPTPCEHFVSQPRQHKPGEKFRITRDMERGVKGYKELVKELNVARRDVERMRQLENSASKDKVVQTSFYKSVVGVR